MVNATNGQNNANPIGLYNLGSTSPEGGSHLVMLENGDYAITYFGGIQIGKWKNIEENVFQFSPSSKESKFELFGRHNKALKSNTKIFFKGFENAETFVQLSNVSEEDYTLQRVFNKEANCFSHPYVHIFKTIANKVLFLSVQHDDTDRFVITFQNPERYNDFVANFIEVDRYEAQPFMATFKDNKLHFEDGEFSGRTPLEEAGEDIEFIKKFIDSVSNRETIYLNPSYHVFGGLDEEDQKDIHEHHVFNEQKNAFIDTEYYVEGEENNLTEDSFENMSIIYVYKILGEYNKEAAKYKINEKSLFQVNCD